MPNFLNIKLGTAASSVAQNEDYTTGFESSRSTNGGSAIRQELHLQSDGDDRRVPQMQIRFFWQSPEKMSIASQCILLNGFPMLSDMQAKLPIFGRDQY